jgi:hypothetical protein
MRCRLRGRYWTLHRGNPGPGNDGLCEPATKTITVRSTLRGEVELDTLIHEMLHACHWDLDEQAITETSEDLARVLFRLGYRITLDR